MQLSVIAVLCLCLTLACGQTIPASWIEDNGETLYWFDHYPTSQASGKINKFSFNQGQNIYLFEELTTSGKSELAASQEISGYSILSFRKRNSDQKFCIQAQKSNQVLFLRNSGAVSRASDYTIEDCLKTSELSAKKKFKAFIAMKGDFELTKWAGMVSNGQYSMSYQVGLVTDANACVDANAKVTVSENYKMSFTSTCITSSDQSYTNPFAGEVYMVSELTDTQLSIGTNSPTSGMVVLAIKVADASMQYYFYIARYGVVTANGMSKLQLFFSTANKNDPTGYILTEYIPTEEQPQTIVLSFSSNECAATNCQNGGTCVQGWMEATCNCAPGFEGASCQDNKDECAPGPCMNGGTCKDLVNAYECDCPPEYDGDRCQLENKCGTNPCKNGGVCNTISSGYLCQCIDPYTGTNCDIMNVCLQEPCKNGGTCFIGDGDSGVYCECAAGFEGETCEDVVPCGSYKCNGQGTCSGQGSDITCVCDPGFTGESCEYVGDCDERICNGQGTCEGENPVTCQCYPGYTGESCENTIGEACEADSCLNGGECVDSAGYFFCKCMSIYAGPRCEDFADWFIVALVLMIIIGIILIIMLFVCCCYCCCGWRPGQTANYRNFPSTSSSTTSVNKQPSTIEFNLSQASPYYGIQVLK